MSTSANSLWVALGMGRAICMHTRYAQYWGVVLVLQQLVGWVAVQLSKWRLRCLGVSQSLCSAVTAAWLHAARGKTRQAIVVALLRATGFQQNWKDQRTVSGVVTLGALRGPARVRLKRGVLRSERVSADGSTNSVLRSKDLNRASRSH